MSTPTLTIEAKPDGDGQLVQLKGDVDLSTSPRLRSRLLSLVADRPGRVIIDLGEVGYMDSSGVGTMVELKRIVERKGGRVVLARLQPRVRSVFEITQLDKFFAIADSLDEAREA